MPRRRLLLALSVALLAPDTAAADPFDRCLATLRASRSARRISAETWSHLRGVRPDGEVLAQLNAQPEFRLPIWDYLAVMVDQERIADGAQRIQQHRDMFDSISRRYSVDVSVLAALWGVESNFGRGTGTFSVLRSLATLSCAGRRQRYFRGELIAALRIVQAGHIAPDAFRGSWAGAFGQTQFMPGVFWGRAVDFDGDGRRDLMSNQGDALASAANYLRQAGWRADVPWGIEVQLPVRPDSAPFDSRGEGRRIRRPLTVWQVRGLRRVDGSALATSPADSQLTMGLYLPAGVAGPAFLVSSNFDAVYRYNASESYTLAILHLSDRFRGAGALVTPWPTRDLGLSRAERRELQTLLLARGHAIGTVDGLLTPATRAAVRAEQVRLAHEPTGRPGQKLLVALRSP